MSYAPIYLTPVAQLPLNIAGNTGALSTLERVLKTRLDEALQQVYQPPTVARDQRLLALIRAHVKESSDLDKTCSDLVNALRNDIRDEKMLAAWIEVSSELLDLRPDNDYNRGVACANLASALQMRLKLGGDVTLLDQIIDLQREGLDLVPKGHWQRALVCSSFVLSVVERYNRTGVRMRIEQAADAAREALALRPVGHPDRVSSCSNLSGILLIQYTRTGNKSLLDETIRLQREALSLTPSDAPFRAAACWNLAGMLVALFDQTADAVLLDEAIDLEREGFALCPVGHPDRSKASGNLARALGRRFDTTHDIALLAETIELDQQALDLRSPGHPYRATLFANLAGSLYKRFQQIGDMASLNVAILHARQALDLRPVGHADRPGSCVMLATLLRHTLGGAQINKAIFDEVLPLLQEAVNLFSEDDPGRWWCLKKLTALALLCGDWPAAIKYLHAVLHSPTHNLYAAISSVAAMIGRINIDAISDDEKRAVLLLYHQAMELVSLATGSAVETPTQLQHIRIGSTLGLEAFILARRIRMSAVGLQLLEQARGVIWSQALHMRDPQLDNVPADLAQRLQSLLGSLNRSRESNESDSTLASLPSSPPSRDNLFIQRRLAQETIREIRSQPGLDNFMLGPGVNALLDTSARSIVVVLAADEQQCHVLMITPNHGPIADMTHHKINKKILEELTFVGMTAQRRGGSASETDTDERGMRVSKGVSPAHACLAKLWRSVVKPILACMGLQKRTGRARPRIHWCCTGAFAFVPIHAAGIYEGPDEECCSDYVVSSYTPTLGTLLRAQQGRHSFTPQQIKLLAIAAEHAQDSNLPRLPYVTEETRHVLDAVTVAGGSVKDASTSSKASVLALIKGSNFVHLACHGVQHKSEPHKSHFSLSTGDLSVSELMELDLKDAFFGFLSACETAKGDQKHADEVIHLAATMLFVGFKSVVATMWAMSDADGPYVAQRLYNGLFEGGVIDLDSIAYALDDAVTALRMSGARPERWATFIHMGA